MVKITSPNKAYTGTSAGVDFKQGVGNTDNPRAIEWLKEHGYTVEGEAAAPPKMTAAEKGAATKAAKAAEAAAKAAAEAAKTSEDPNPEEEAALAAEQLAAEAAAKEAAEAEEALK